ARLVDAVFFGPQVTWADVARLACVYREARAQQAQATPGTAYASRSLIVGASKEAARAAARGYLERTFAMYRSWQMQEPSMVRLGEDSAAYAGGTELLLMMKLGLLRPRHLVDGKRIRGFGEIGLESHLGPRGPSPATAGGANSEGTRLTIGAAVTHRAVERSALVGARCPLVGSVARHVANVRVRNVGTVGGNLAFADPHSDL